MIIITKQFTQSNTVNGR